MTLAEWLTTGVNLLFTLLWGALFSWELRRDRRRLRCGALAILTLSAGISVIASLMPLVRNTAVEGLVAAFALAGALALWLTILALPAMLMWNGLTLMRREGLRPTNMLSFLLGLGLVVAPVSAVYLLSMGSLWTVGVAIELFFLCVYLGAFLVILLVQTGVHRLWGGAHAIPHPDAVVVHGAGLIDGKVTPLLGSRVRKGVEIWQSEALRRRGLGLPAPFLVMSGGQGPDEPVSEASAMAEFATTLGVPAQAITLEDRSTTTRENIHFSRELLAQLSMLQGRPAQNVLLVTSDYHAARTAILASDMGTRWEVAPARTARYYVANAWLREYVAVLTYRRRAATMWGVCMALVALTVGLFGWISYH